MDWGTIALLAGLYVVGALFTAWLNLSGMVYMTRPLAVLRNVIFWPFFIWPLWLTRD